MKKLLFLVLPAVLILSACTSPTTTQPESNSTSQQTAIASPDSIEENQMPEQETQDIVDTAIASPDHTTLVSAVTAAGLVETLRGRGPFTVFAPTNAAFSALPAGTVEGLLMPEKKTDLTNILTYHVVAGSYMANDLTEGLKLTTVQGQDITFTTKNGNWHINGTAMISATDIAASNGVIHVIDSVIMPK